MKDADAQAGVTTVDDPTWPNAGGHSNNRLMRATIVW